MTYPLDEMKHRIIQSAIFFLTVVPMVAQNITIFFLEDGSIVQGQVVNENHRRIFLKTEQGTIKIFPKDIIGREDLARNGDLSYISERVDHLQNHVDHLTGQVQHDNDSLGLVLENLYELLKNLEALQNELEIDLLRLHSHEKGQKKQINNILNTIDDHRVDIAYNRRNVDGVKDTVATLNKTLVKAGDKIETLENQSYLLTGTVSNIRSELQDAKTHQENQQNQIDIMAGSLANLIQEVQKVQKKFFKIDLDIKHNRNAISELSSEMETMEKSFNDRVDELSATMETMEKSFNDRVDELSATMETMEKNLNNRTAELSTEMGKIENKLIEKIESNQKAIQNVDKTSIKARKKLSGDINNLRDAMDE